MASTRANYALNDTLKEIGYYISVGSKDIPIEPAYITDAQIVWDVNELCVEGYVLFEDVYRITEVIPTVGSLLFKIRGKDVTGMAYEEKFAITRLEKQYSNDKKMTVQISLIDTAYFYLANTYFCRGYNNVKVSDVVKNIIEDKKIFPNGISSKKLSFYDTNNTYDNLVIPSNKPLTSFIKQKELTDGFSYYQTRKEIVMLSHDKISTHLPDVYGRGRGIKFTYDDAMDELNPFKIKTLKFLPSDNLLFNALLPDTATYVFNQENMSKPNISVKDVGNLALSVGDESKLPNMNSTTGYKRAEATHQSSMDRFYKFKLLESMLIEVTVSGLFSYELLWKVGVELKSTVDGYKGMMPYVNGGYHILRIVDKYQGSSFNQIITLGRVGLVSNFTKDTE